MTKRFWYWCLAFTAVLAISLAVWGPVASAANVRSGTITVGELFPFTGTKAELSAWGVHGDAAAIHDVNSHGGVMGKQLVTTTADTAGDAVDAVPALRQLLTKSPSVIIGPFSLVIESVIRDFGPAHTVDFMIGGTTQLDHMQYPYVFRTADSDSDEVVAMAYYAIHQGHKRAAFVFDNSANTQGLVAPLRRSYTRQGGKVVANVTIVPDQSSYRSEVIKAFAQHPNVVFIAFDEQTATTFFAAARELGHLNVQYIGEDVIESPGYAKAMGQPQARFNLLAAAGAPPGGAAYKHFLDDYQAVYHTRQALPSTYNMYDAVIIAALAMTDARSSNPAVWVHKVTAVSNPPGHACSTYASCVSLLKKGKKINYEGASGPDDFNQYHNVSGGFAISGFNRNDQLREVAYIGPKTIASHRG
ncbi:MAG: ABC transporter substrate-binding protein [Chloroflexota bacterium]|nr:ABC transporter substrate-binding protein [Chloroflexota bacterium]